MSVAMILSYKQDIKDPLVTQAPVTLLMQGDNQANVIELTLMDGASPASLDGYSATVYLQRADGVQVRCPGTVSGNVATVPLQAECYSVPGQYAAIMKLSGPNELRTVLRLAGYVESDGQGVIIDPSGSIPSYEDLERIIQELEEALQQAETATSSANTAAQNANEKAAIADTAAGNANAAAGNANAGAGRANEAAASIEGLTVEASDVAYNQPATAEVSDVEGHKHIAFGLRQGVPGVVPNITFTGETGEPNTDVVVTQSGTPESPVVNLKIPQGVPGTGNVSTVDGVASDSSGNVPLDAVRYVAQTLEDAKKVQVRKNIGVDGQVYPCTATALEAMSMEDLVNIYNQGYRAVQTTNNETVVLLGLSADGSLDWLGCNQPRGSFLDNENFVVAQAGYGGKHGAVSYAADRWASIGVVVSDFEDGLPISKESEGAAGSIYQNMGDSFPAGKIVTLAAKINGIIYAQSGEVSSDGVSCVSQTNEFSLYCHGGSAKRVVITLNSMTPIKIEWISMLHGRYTPKTLPPWEEPNFMTELNKCLYYFRIVGDPGAVTKVSDGILSVYGGLGAPMRVPPTLVLRVETIDLNSGQDLVFTPNGEITASTTEHAIKFANIPGTFSVPIPNGFVKMNSAGILYAIADL